LRLLPPKGTPGALTICQAQDWVAQIRNPEGRCGRANPSAQARGALAGRSPLHVDVGQWYQHAGAYGLAQSEKWIIVPRPPSETDGSEDRPNSQKKLFLL
jgi:hypothetical protein